MKPEEMKIWSEELDRVHEQCKVALNSYHDVLMRAKAGEFSVEDRKRMIEVFSDSLRLCQNDVDRTQKQILALLS